MIDFAGKNVLVAGATGFIGTNLVMKLIETGAKVRGTVHKSAPRIVRDIEYISCDLQSPDDYKKVVEDMDYVFMCAANTSGASVMTNNPLSHVTPNIIMNTLLLDAAYKAKVKKYLFISTNTVYPQTDHPVREEEMMSGPLFEKYFCVGWMKRFSEILCEMYSSKIKKPMQTVVIRPGNCLGPFDDFEWETSHVLPALMRKVIERHDPIEVWGDGNDIKDFIYVEDLVEGILLSMQKINSFDPINIASGHPSTIKEALQIMIDIEGYTPEIIFDASKPTMIPKRLINVNKAKMQLGFEAKTTLSEGIAKTMEWYKNQYA